MGLYSEDPLFDDPSLPTGWYRKVVQRQTGLTAGQWDVYIFNPEGKKFRSKAELKTYFIKQRSPLNWEDFNFSVTGKGKLKTPTMRAKTGGSKEIQIDYNSKSSRPVLSNCMTLSNVSRSTSTPRDRVVGGPSGLQKVQRGPNCVLIRKRTEADSARADSNTQENSIETDPLQLVEVMIKEEPGVSGALPQRMKDLSAQISGLMVWEKTYFSKLSSMNELSKILNEVMVNSILSNEQSNFGRRAQNETLTKMETLAVGAMSSGEQSIQTQTVSALDGQISSLKQWDETYLGQLESIKQVVDILNVTLQGAMDERKLILG